MQKKMQPKNFSLPSLWSELSEDEQAAVSGGSREYTGPEAVLQCWSLDDMLPPVKGQPRC